MLLSDIIKAWSALKNLKDELNAKHKKIIDRMTEEMTALASQIIKRYANEEIKSQVIGEFLYYMKVETYAKASGMRDLIKWLKSHRLESLVTETVSTQTLKKYVREIEKLGGVVPDCVNTYDEITLNRRKAVEKKEKIEKLLQGKKKKKRKNKKKEKED